jgi:CDP-glycerol glycerophosphotransferase
MQTIYYNTLSFIIRILDIIYPKDKSYWGFPVHHIKSDQFIENARAVFEEVKKDPKIYKVLFTRDDTIEFEITAAVNYRIVNMLSISGILLLIKCKVLFVTHSVSMDYSIRYGKSKFTVLKLNMINRNVINLWHGIPIKKLYALWNPKVKKRLDRVEYRNYERKKYSGLISTSTIDSYSMSTMFHPIKYENVWITGLPKNDLLLQDYNSLAEYFKKQVDKIRNLKNGKRLITYAPTYRQTTAVNSSQYYQFTNEEIEKLKEFLKKNNAIFGFRMHYFRNDSNLFNIEYYIDNEYIFDLGHKNVTEVAAVIRESDIVVSDYSSVFIESLYVNKPVFGFTYDIEHYRDHQDGLLYDFEMIFPSPIIKKFDELLVSIENELLHPFQVNSDKYKISQKIFFNHIDAYNSKRLVQNVFKLLN